MTFLLIIPEVNTRSNARLCFVENPVTRLPLAQ